ncbi:hypothetical protein NG54_03350 [Heyndrickxia ginsengihumi]|uniref:Uncharacterized protein n=1 Tax=Heyndrickxia ginsengihumi TaxID=363870 RepID=A0A0A6VDN8_9BACI|nr:hypothetical protein [Heyndrickxia ginsengihumi]KHD86365.1 hypothetical protein NG54_03350 [Heyndrickxia ginsengihumi]
MADKTNGKITNVELEMALDEARGQLPYLIESTVIQGKILKAKFDNLIAAGFTEEQALEIVKARPVYE